MKKITTTRTSLVLFGVLVFTMAIGQSDERCKAVWFTKDDSQLGLRSVDSVDKLRQAVNHKIWGSVNMNSIEASEIGTIDHLEPNENALIWNLVQTLNSVEMQAELASGLWRADSERSFEILRFKLKNEPEFSADCACRCAASPWFRNDPIAFRFFNPKLTSSNAMILHQGHVNTVEIMNEGKWQMGFLPLIDSLVARGYQVLFLFMTQMNPLEYSKCGTISGGGNDPSGNCHSCLLRSTLKGDQDNAMGILRVHLEPIAIAVQFLLKNGAHSVHMVGLSGGAWLTTLYSALDERITTSYSVDSGLWPRYLSSQIPGDFDYGAPIIYDNLQVQEMYVLGSLGQGRAYRSHTEVYIRRSVSNGETNYYASDFYNPYKPHLGYSDALDELRDRVKKKVGRLGGDFDLVIDNSTSTHQISDSIRNSVILKKLAMFKSN